MPVNKLPNEQEIMNRGKVFLSTAHFVLVFGMWMACWSEDTIIVIILWFFVLIYTYKFYDIYSGYFMDALRQVSCSFWVLLSILIALVTPLYIIVYIHEGRIGGLELSIDGIIKRLDKIEFDVFQLTLRVDNMEYKLNNLTKVVDGLSTTVGIISNQVQRVDNRLNQVQKKLDNMYTDMMDNSPNVKWADTMFGNAVYNIMKKFKKDPITRRDFGLGCFIGGTQIQISKHGDVISVEALMDGDFIYNPILDKEMRIKTFIAGPENGYLYNVSTTDGLYVIVTETHPMILCDNTQQMSCQNNIAVKNVFVGNRTLTKNGLQRINNVTKIKSNDLMVYNFMYDMDNHDNILFHSVIANGIYTLDLYAQQHHH